MDGEDVTGDAGARVNFVVILSDGVVWLLTDGKEEFASLVTLLPTSPPVRARVASVVAVMLLLTVGI